MHPLRSLRDDLTDDSLRFAIRAGLATIPFTFLLSWNPASGDGVVLGGEISAAPALVAGSVVGYRYADRTTDGRRAGFWTGLAAGGGTALVYVGTAVTSMRSASPEVAGVIAAATPVVVAVGIGLTVLVATMGAAITGWVRTRVDRDRSVPVHETDARSDARDSRWWILVPAYVLAAPPISIAALRMVPATGVGTVAAVLGVIALVLLSIGTFVALFVDATAPRDAKTEWDPNVGLYVGTPVGAAAIVYVAATLREWGDPSAIGTYGFLAGLWVTSLVYLAIKRRTIGTRSTPSEA